MSNLFRDLSIGFTGFSLALAVSGATYARAAERIPPGEGRAIEAVLRMIEEQVHQDTRASRDGVARRDAHAKHHGCVRAKFTTLGGLPAMYAAGLFAAPSDHEAWIRYSNGSGRSQDDSVGDGRGMAIKVLGVPGEKLLESERDATTQDFILINHPVFFVRNALDYVDFQSNVLKGSPMGFFFPGLNPFNWRAQELKIANDITSHRMLSPLQSDYWSETPYLLGAQEIKFATRPCAARSIQGLTREGPGFLRRNLKIDLARGGACFVLGVQRRTDPASMPIEDPTVEWDEDRAPYTAVARIEIPPQDFTGVIQDTFCENLSFTPWHSLPEHRPLGGINRARRTVYEGISRLRHRLNGAERREP